MGPVPPLDAPDADGRHDRDDPYRGDRGDRGAGPPRRAMQLVLAVVSLIVILSLIASAVRFPFW